MTSGPLSLQNNSPRPDYLGWIVLGVIGTTGLSLAYVHAPLRLKLPLISPLVLGALGGWGLGRWAIARMVDSRPVVAGVAAAIVALGQIAIAAETYRLGVKSVRVELNRIRLERDPFADEIEKALAEASDDEAERLRLKAEHEDARRRRAEEFQRLERQATFPGYLEQRIPRTWGRWPAPWPHLFWGTEVLLSSLLAAGIAARVIRQQPAAAGGTLRSQPEASAGTSDEGERQN